MTKNLFVSVDYCINSRHHFSQEYRESIPQDMKPGSEVMRISATDIDDGENRLIEYDLHENFTYQYFKVDRETGIVRLNQPITDVSEVFDINVKFVRGGE